MAHISMKLYIAFSLVTLLAVAVWLKIIDLDTITIFFTVVGIAGVYMTAIALLPFILLGWLMWRFGKRPTN
jgi:hypothetical protein